MLIFDYFSLFLVLLINMTIFGDEYGQNLISRQRIRVKLRQMFRWETLVISFSKINKSIYKNEI